MVRLIRARFSLRPVISKVLRSYRISLGVNIGPCEVSRLICDRRVVSSLLVLILVLRNVCVSKFRGCLSRFSSKLLMRTPSLLWVM